jgi:hypothetical protein
MIRKTMILDGWIYIFRFALMQTCNYQIETHALKPLWIKEHIRLNKNKNAEIHHKY